MFKKRKQVYPMLALRSHFFILSKKIHHLQSKLGLDYIDLFLTYEQQLKKIIRNKTDIKINDYFADFNKMLSSIEKEFYNIDGFPINSFNVFKKRFEKEFSRLESKILKFEKTKNSDLTHYLTSINNHLKPTSIPQERIVSFIPYYIKYGQAFFDLLIEESSIFDNKYTILTEE